MFRPVIDLATPRQPQGSYVTLDALQWHYRKLATDLDALNVPGDAKVTRQQLADDFNAAPITRGKTGFIPGQLQFSNDDMQYITGEISTLQLAPDTLIDCTVFKRIYENRVGAEEVAVRIRDLAPHLKRLQQRMAPTLEDQHENELNIDQVDAIKTAVAARANWAMKPHMVDATLDYCARRASKYAVPADGKISIPLYGETIEMHLRVPQQLDTNPFGRINWCLDPKALDALARVQHTLMLQMRERMREKAHSMTAEYMPESPLRLALDRVLSNRVYFQISYAKKTKAMKDVWEGLIEKAQAEAAVGYKDSEEGIYALLASGRPLTVEYEGKPITMMPSLNADSPVFQLRWQVSAETAEHLADVVEKRLTEKPEQPLSVAKMAKELGILAVHHHAAKRDSRHATYFRELTQLHVALNKRVRAQTQDGQADTINVPYQGVSFAMARKTRGKEWDFAPGDESIAAVKAYLGLGATMDMKQADEVEEAIAPKPQPASGGFQWPGLGPSESHASTAKKSKPRGPRGQG